MSDDDLIATVDTLTAPDSPLRAADAIASPVYRDLSTPRVGPGDEAPDFALPVFDAAGGDLRPTGTVARLSEHRGKRPVALIFGSYT